MVGALTWGWAEEREKGYRCLPLLFVFEDRVSYSIALVDHEFAM